MSTNYRFSAILGLLAVFLVLGCATEKVTSVSDNIPSAYVGADGANQTMRVDTLRNRFPHLLMADGRITINDRCPVRKASLNKRLPTLFVNGQPLGFC